MDDERHMDDESTSADESPTCDDKPLPPSTTPACPVCGDPLAHASILICSLCRTPHHRRCWSYNRGCATFACGSRLGQRPPQTAVTHRDGRLVIPSEVVTSPRESDGTAALAAVIMIPALVLMTGFDAGLAVFAAAAVAIILLSLLLYARDNLVSTELLVDERDSSMTRAYLLFGRVLRTVALTKAPGNLVSLRLARQSLPRGLEAHVVIHRLFGLLADGREMALAQRTVEAASVGPEADDGLAGPAQRLAELTDCVVLVDMPAGLEHDRPGDEAPALPDGDLPYGD